MPAGYKVRIKQTKQFIQENQYTNQYLIIGALRQPCCRLIGQSCLFYVSFILAMRSHEYFYMSKIRASGTVYLTGRVVGCRDVYRSLFELEDGFPCSLLHSDTCTCVMPVDVCSVLDVVSCMLRTSICMCMACSQLGSITTPTPYIIQPSSPFIDSRHLNQKCSIQSLIVLFSTSLNSHQSGIR